MRISWIVLLLGLGAVSCVSFPAMRPLQNESEKISATQRCEKSFPKKPFRAVHTIEATMPMGNMSAMLGVSQVDPVTRTLRAVLVSVEGVTLFDASIVKGVLDVHRAVAPFDEPDFARGLANDVSLVLLEPGGEMLTGIGYDGSLVCRYKDVDGGVVDIVLSDHKLASMELRVYDKGADLVRIVKFFDESGPMGFAKKVVLSTPGLVGYELVMKLVGAEKVSPSDSVSR